MLKDFLLFFLYFILFSECSFQNYQLSNVSILESFAKMKDNLFDKTLVYGQLNGNSIVSGFNTGS